MLSYTAFSLRNFWAQSVQFWGVFLFACWFCVRNVLGDGLKSLSVAEPEYRLCPKCFTVAFPKARAQNLRLLCKAAACLSVLSTSRITSINPWPSSTPEFLLPSLSQMSKWSKFWGCVSAGNRGPKQWPKHPTITPGKNVQEMRNALFFVAFSVYRSGSFSWSTSGASGFTSWRYFLCKSKLSAVCCRGGWWGSSWRWKTWCGIT